MAARWSTAEDQLLRQLHGEQLPINEIAARLAHWVTRSRARLADHKKRGVYTFTYKAVYR